jgi:hypothetical protein
MTTIEVKREKTRIRNILWRQNNREQYIKSAKKYRDANEVKIKNYKLKTNYGISLEQYNVMFEKQDGKCAICGNPEYAIHNSTKRVQKLAVDHCHKTKKIRGLLCQDCNRGIGKFHDDISRLKNAINYLSNSQPA